MTSQEIAIIGVERLLQIKNIFAENNLPITDDIALKVLSLLKGEEIFQYETFQRMLQFGIQLLLLNISSPNVEEALISQEKLLFGDDIPDIQMLKNAMHVLSYNQSNLAALMNVSQSFISKILSGRRKLQREHRKEIQSLVQNCTNI